MASPKTDSAPATLPPSEDDLPIDALEIRAVKRRFLALNQDRMRRVQEAMRERQRDFLELLPLLYHINHPMLPGFISTSTPCGISDYTPASAASTPAGAWRKASATSAAPCRAMTSSPST
jgi:adenylate cyclase